MWWPPWYISSAEIQLVFNYENLQMIQIILCVLFLERFCSCPLRWPFPLVSTSLPFQHFLVGVSSEHLLSVGSNLTFQQFVFLDSPHSQINILCLYLMYISEIKQIQGHQRMCRLEGSLPSVDQHTHFMHLEERMLKMCCLMT